MNIGDIRHLYGYSGFSEIPIRSDAWYVFGLTIWSPQGHGTSHVQISFLKMG